MKKPTIQESNAKAAEVALSGLLVPRKPKHAQEGEITGAEMTKSCARDLTDQIKAAAGNLADMLHRAHDERAWLALGYASWKEYCVAEFQFSEQRSYQLLTFVEIKNTLADTQPGVEPTSEKQVRPLAKLPPEKKRKAWKRAVEIADGKPPSSKQVERAVEEASPPKEPPALPPLDPELQKKYVEIDEEISLSLKLSWKVLRAHGWEDFLAGVQR